MSAIDKDLETIEVMRNTPLDGFNGLNRASFRYPVLARAMREMIEADFRYADDRNGDSEFRTAFRSIIEAADEEGK